MMMMVVLLLRPEQARIQASSSFRTKPST